MSQANVMDVRHELEAVLDRVLRDTGCRAIAIARTDGLVVAHRGASWLDPGEETNTWSSRDANDMEPGDHWYGPVDETYFIIRGRLRLTWDEGVLDVGPDDAVYLAPGWTYHLKNVGDEPAFFVYSMTPTPE